MLYKDYLNTEHWKQFRQKIYRVRKICQNCSRKDKPLNIHHIVYNRFNEKEDEVIVLCQECHGKLHKRKKWIIKYRNGEPLNFTHTSRPDSLLYSQSEVKRKCNRCGLNHPVFYKMFKNGKKHLSIACPTSKPRITFIPFEEGLNIPTLTRDFSKKEHIEFKKNSS